jgi:SAM-dependent MidA family methyltransferase
VPNVAAERLRTLILERGPITFARYMHEALYGAGGFYERPPVGAARHFVTSPHVHPVFSRLLGRALEELWHLLDRPDPFRVVEVGGGDGTLARQLIDGFDRAGVRLRYAGVETSPGARSALSGIAAETVDRLSAVEPLEPGVVVANELLDNLPFRRIRRRSGSLVEVRVGLDGDRLIEVEAPADPELEALAPDLAEGQEHAVPIGALAFVDEVAATLRRGYALLIDYGAASPTTVRGYRGHRLLDDVLDEPGSADITTDVDMDAVIARAHSHGFGADGPVPQRHALRALGLDEWLRAELSHQGELLRGGRGLPAVRTWQGRTRARLLVDPAGLGRLGWVLLRTEGLASPSWTRRPGDEPPD